MTVTTVIPDLASSQAALEVAAELTSRTDGHLDVLCLGIDRTQPSFYYTGTHATTIQSNMAEAEKSAIEIETSVEELLQLRNLTWTTQPLFTQ